MNILKKFIWAFFRIIRLEDLQFYRDLEKGLSTNKQKALIKKVFNLIKKDLGYSFVISLFKRVNNRFNVKLYRFYFDQCNMSRSDDKNKPNKEDIKIVGYILTWNNLEFFKYSLQQALEFCDKVLLIEGSHFQKYPKRSTDGTIEFINQMKRHKKLRIFDFNFKGRNDVVQQKIRLALLKYARFCKPGSWLIPWDDDFFFFREDLKKIKEIMRTTEYDTLVFSKERRFIYNFRYNTSPNKNGDIHIDRITKGGYLEGKIKKRLLKFKKQNEHYWEIGIDKYSEDLIRNTIKNHFGIEKEIRLRQNTYHHFYLLKK